MGFMSEEEILNFNKNNSRVDTGVTKRTCATCTSAGNCDFSIWFLENTSGTECRLWSPSFKKCRNGKNAAPAETFCRVECVIHQHPDDEPFTFDTFKCEGGWELAQKYERYGVEAPKQRLT